MNQISLVNLLGDSVVVGSWRWEEKTSLLTRVDERFLEEVVRPLDPAWRRSINDSCILTVRLSLSLSLFLCPVDGYRLTDSTRWFISTLTNSTPWLEKTRSVLLYVLCGSFNLNHEFSIFMVPKFKIPFEERRHFTVTINPYLLLSLFGGKKYLLICVICAWYVGLINLETKSEWIHRFGH